MSYFWLQKHFTSLRAISAVEKIRSKFSSSKFRSELSIRDSSASVPSCHRYLIAKHRGESDRKWTLASREFGLIPKGKNARQKLAIGQGRVPRALSATEGEYTKVMNFRLHGLLLRREIDREIARFPTYKLALAENQF